MREITENDLRWAQTTLLALMRAVLKLLGMLIVDVAILFTLLLALAVTVMVFSKLGVSNQNG